MFTRYRRVILIAPESRCSKSQRFYTEYIMLLSFLKRASNLNTDIYNRKKNNYKNREKRIKRIFTYRTLALAFSHVDLGTVVYVGTTLLERHVAKNGKEQNEKGKEENRAAMSAMPRTFGVYQSRGCRIREKRAELTVERVYVKSSTVIDSLPSSTLLRVDHEGVAGGVVTRGWCGIVKGVAEEERAGCWFSGRRPSVHRPSLGAPCLVVLHPSPPGPL